MKKHRMLLLFGSIVALNARAQTFLPASSTEVTAPSATGSFPSGPLFMDNNVNSLSNTDFPSPSLGLTVKAAGWAHSYAAGGGGGFIFGYDGLTGVPLLTSATTVPGAVDLQIGYLEGSTIGQNYIVISYYSRLSNAYIAQLYQLTSSTATLVYTQTLMTSTYNRISMDVNHEAKRVAFAWSDGADVYTATAELNAPLNKLDFSSATPALRITNSSMSHKLLPDVAFKHLAGPTGIDSIVYAYYNDSASQVVVAQGDYLVLYPGPGPAMVLPPMDWQTTSGSVAVKLDAPIESPGDVWGYVYTDDFVNIKVRHKGRAGVPVSIVLNDGSMPFGVAPMTGPSSFSPVIAYNEDPDRYHVGWVTSYITAPYFFSSYTYLYLYLTDYSGTDAVLTNPDYLLIPQYPEPAGTSLAPYLSFSRTGQHFNLNLYSVHTQRSPIVSLYNLVHKNHPHGSLSTFKLAATTANPALAVSPNPSSGSFRLDIPGALAQEQISFELSDMLGRHIAHYAGLPEAANAHLQQASADLMPGSYILSAKAGAQQQVFKLQKTAP